MANRQDLIAKVKENIGEGTTKKAAEATVSVVLDSIKELVAADGNLQLIGFGTFDVVERAERTGRNPQTGEEMTIAAGKRVKFKPGKAFKEAVK